MAKKGKSKAKGTRRSKAESMTGAKENAVEVRRANGVGHNSDLALPEPVTIASDDFQMHFKAAKAATEKKDTAVNLLRGVYKAAQKLHPQLPAAIKKAIAIERDPDPFRIKAELEVLGIALKETQCPIQLTVHDTLLGDVKEQAYKRGYSAGEKGQTANCPYPEGSDLGVEYLRGHLHGTGKNMGMTPEQVDAAVHESQEAAGAH